VATETAFVMSTSSIKFGTGATRELGYDMRALGARRIMVVVDPHMINSEQASIVLDSLALNGLHAVIFDQVRVEPTDLSFKSAIQFASEGNFDGYVALGGGSTIDTAKVADLYATYPADFLSYVNAPVGGGRPVPGKLAPLIAIPTTAGTGSETTGTAIFDFVAMHVKTGIAHPALRPVMGIIDPDNTRTLPKMVAACTGWDVLCHAIESITAIPYNQMLAPGNPGLRPAYQGSNPISDVWATQAIEMVSANLLKVLRDPEDAEARSQMILASCFAGIGFGNAGVHLPHAMSYPVAGLVREYYPNGYRSDHPMVPHGMAVTLSAPAVFRFTARTDPQRHLYAAGLMGADVSGVKPGEAGDLLASILIDLMHETAMPNGLRAVGFSKEDLDALVAGALSQQRLIKLSPCPVGPDDLKRIFLEAMSYW